VLDLRKILVTLLLMLMVTALLVGCKSEEEKKREAAQELEKQIFKSSEKVKADRDEAVKKWREKGPKQPESTTQKQ
jgi:ABC-type nitrate/sulfonate/bicarbonate transport system substrate-binding protein